MRCFIRELLPSFNGQIAEIVGNVILSHDFYLQDFLKSDWSLPYLNRVRDKELPEFEHAKELFFYHVISEVDFQAYVSCALAELEAYMMTPFAETDEAQLMFLTKFVFSSLIDADRTNTRLFEENKTEEPSIDHKQLFDSYYGKLMEKIRSFESNKHGNNPLSTGSGARCRSNVINLQKSRQASIRCPSPWEGARRWRSFRDAVRHASIHNKKQIIYIVPYTTIIEQNAQEVRDILKDDRHILEHHSNVIEDDYDDDEQQDGRLSTQQKLKLAKDNWDSPIIFTTMVQFLNVFYAKGSRNIRRLHHLSEAVIIFDEVQKVPVSSVSVFNAALNFLKTYAR